MKKDIIKKAFDNAGSDKSVDHFYENGYCQVLPDKANNILEIGIANVNASKSSVHAWTELYPDANIYALDTVLEKLINDGKVASFHVDQSDAIDLYNFTSIVRESNIKFDVIVDDGSHIFSHAKLTFEFLFPLTQNNGVYCVEDIQKNSHSIQQTVYDWEMYLSEIKGIKYKVYDTNPNVNDDSVIIAVWRHDESN